MSTNARKKRSSKRLISWILVYLVILALFLISIIRQGGKVNTLGFAPGQILLSVSKTKYTVGDTISYTITNGLNKPVTLEDHCPSEPLHVYQWESSQWVRIHDQAKTSVCANQPNQVQIPPDSSITKNYANWPNLFNKPGIYRIVAFADNYTALPYADFQVVDKPAPAPAPQIIYKPVYTPVYTPIYVSGGGDHHSGGGGDN